MFTSAAKRNMDPLQWKSNPLLLLLLQVNFPDVKVYLISSSKMKHLDTPWQRLLWQQQTLTSSKVWKPDRGVKSQQCDRTGADERICVCWIKKKGRVKLHHPAKKCSTVHSSQRIHWCLNALYNTRHALLPINYACVYIAFVKVLLCCREVKQLVRVRDKRANQKMNENTVKKE